MSSAQITSYQSQFYAWHLSRETASDSVDALASTLVDAQVDLNPHQVEAALFACRNPLSRGVILADEVGLGKTIEAGLVMSQWWAERRRKMVIIVPASLRKQWHQELQDKFGLQSQILESKSWKAQRKQGKANPFAAVDGPIICSYPFAKARAAELKGVPWDLVIFDEAHRLRNVYKSGNVIAKTLRDALAHVRARVLLTATPLQNSLSELYGLVSIIDDRVFGDLPSFRSQFVGPGKDHHFDNLRQRLASVCKRTLRKQVQPYVSYTARRAIVQEFTPSDEEHALSQQVADYLRRPHLKAMQDGQRQLISLVLWKLLASSNHAIAGALDTMANRLQAVLDDDAEANLADGLNADYESLAETAEEWPDDAEREPPLGTKERKAIAAEVVVAAADHKPVFTSEADRQTAKMVLEEMGRYETRHAQVPTSHALLNDAVQTEIAENVSRRLAEQAGVATGNLLEGVDHGETTIDVASIAKQTTQAYVERSIDIPRIAVVPKGEVTTRFEPFKLDVSGLKLQPGKREIVGQELHSNEQFRMAAEQGLTEKRPEDYIVHKLIDYDDIDYFTQADLLYELAGQMVAHLRSYLSGDEATQVLDRERGRIAREIHAQMMAHFREDAAGYEVQVNRGFTAIKPCHYTAAGRKVHSYRETVKQVTRIKQMLFGGFSKCLYPLQKFDSDTERRFAVILERDVLKWFKPAKGQFQLYYKLGAEQPEYVPDFVIETEDGLYMAETKRRDEVQSVEVQAKAQAAVEWCRNATDYVTSVGSKPWTYLLIPHDQVVESKQFSDYVATCKK